MTKRELAVVERFNQRTGLKCREDLFACGRLEVGGIERARPFPAYASKAARDALSRPGSSSLPWDSANAFIVSEVLKFASNRPIEEKRIRYQFNSLWRQNSLVQEAFRNSSLNRQGRCEDPSTVVLDISSHKAVRSDNRAIWHQRFAIWSQTPPIYGLAQNLKLSIPRSVHQPRDICGWTVE